MKSLYALIVILALCYSLATVGQTQNQQPAPESTRHLVVKVAPEYPESAKRLRLGGTVKVVAVVGTDGKVKRVQTVGGSPLLVQSAERAVAQWKYAPGKESEESVELHFNPLD
jgi:TonB family protein